MNDYLIFERIVEKVNVTVGLARDIANRQIIASCEEIGIGMANGESVGIGPDVIENSVKIPFVGYDLIVEAVFKYMVYTYSTIDCIFESCDKESQMLGKSRFNPY